nr:MAG TPA: dimeris T4 recombination endonuclease VII [Caudoviricetes sp.]
MRLIRGNVERVTESPQEQQLLIKEGYKPIDEEKETEAPPQAEELAESTVKQLRQKAKERGIAGVEALSKAELLEIMEES